MTSVAEPLQRAVSVLSSRTFVTFAELEGATGLTRDQLIASKSDIEAALRDVNPDTALTSRVDLSPEGFEVSG